MRTGGRRSAYQEGLLSWTSEAPIIRCAVDSVRRAGHLIVDVSGLDTDAAINGAIKAVMDAGIDPSSERS